MINKKEEITIEFLIMKGFKDACIKYMELKTNIGRFILYDKEFNMFYATSMRTGWETINNTLEFDKWAKVVNSKQKWEN